MSTISYRAVIVGAIVDVAASMLGTLVTVIYLVNRIVVTQGAAATHPGAAPIAPPPGTSTALLLIGLAGCVLGGYVAARIAKRDPLLHGAASTVLVVLLTLVAAFAKDADVKLQLIAIVLSPLFGIAGGFIARTQSVR